MPDAGKAECFDPERHLARLKPFQRRTVEHVIRRFYTDPDPTHRFLVADEVGLGKTMVARGVIAQAIAQLQHQTDRVDIVYICSNAAIARQNISRLNVTGASEIAMATRPTMLLTHLAGARSPRRNRINFVSFTPGTMDTRSRTGIKAERALLHHVLRDMVAPVEGLYELLQVHVGDDAWAREVEWAESEAEIDANIAQRFRAAVGARPSLVDRLQTCARACAQDPLGTPDTWGAERNAVIGELRHVLAETCIAELDPDLVILDEFQRFRHVMDGSTTVGELAHHLFRYTDQLGNRARTLLLSATPYLMPLVRDQDGVDHYGDFLNTLRFLFNDAACVETLKAELEAYRDALYAAAAGEAADLPAARAAVEQRLRRVMVRTERVDSTAEMDAMIQEHRPELALETPDVAYGVALERLARASDAGGTVELWKSASYALNVMHRDYRLRERLDAHPTLSTEQAAAARMLIRNQIRADDVRAYRPLATGNARQRHLHAETLDAGQWRLLWLPPAQPYARLGRPFDQVTNATKTLIFCAWDAAPNSIAALASYEAERRMLASGEAQHGYDAHSQQAQPLALDRDSRTAQPNSMTALALMYPAPALARAVDPLRLAAQAGGDGGAPPTPEALHEAARDRVQKLLNDACVPRSDEAVGQADTRWYWVALAWLDASTAEVREWLLDDGAFGWLTQLGAASRGAAYDHAVLFARAMNGEIRPTGHPPADLADVLTDLALAGPGVTALRALSRQAPDTPLQAPEMLSASAKIAEGFRRLFNQPEAVAIVRSVAAAATDAPRPYWRAVLGYARAGELQAVLDEFTHVLGDMLGVQDTPAGTRMSEMAQEIRRAMGLLGGEVHMQPFELDPDARLCAPKPIPIRTRYALRIGAVQDSEGGELRLEQIQRAFNSPFRPFVLATTSIGQEGLDFHWYCHAVHHWNLPSTPVEMEQREGRVHRYKGHVIRRNLAEDYGVREMAPAGEADDRDPWDRLFDAAERAAGRQSDLVPYWIYEGGRAALCVERHLPHLPHSKDSARLEALRRSLAIYRLAFGQPRQADLIHYLEDRLGHAAASRLARDWQIRLTPPA